MVVATKRNPKVVPVIKKKEFVLEPTRQEILLPEMERIRNEYGGALRAQDVVADAESENSPLHRYFTWDDTEAAYQHRLWQARQLISAVVVMLPYAKRSITAYVSLRDDRRVGIYRPIVEVMSNADMRNQFLAEALDDLRTWERKYNRLVELVPIFEAIKNIRGKNRKKK
ncbi:MAG: hypothetical protein Q8O16_02335 [Dehalococcoidia bacterium]|nr:hypothetical protein [Dehalococcoidia bacterium]